MTSQAREQEAARGGGNEIPGGWEGGMRFRVVGGGSEILGGGERGMRFWVGGSGGEEESSQPLLAARATGFRSE